MSEDLKMAAFAISAFVGSIILAILARWILRAVAAPIYRKTKSPVDNIIFKCLEKPLMLAIIAGGLYAAALIVINLDLWQFSAERTAIIIGKTGQAFRAIITVVVAVAALRILNSLARWFAQTTETRGMVYQIETFKKLINIVIWALLVVLVLSQLGYKVSALLAGLGVAGLAVALALQDTLANIFAGFYIAADKSLKVNDYVKLESGEEGFVEEIGWRNTRIRLWANNMVIVPNSKLIQSIITNYDLPQQQMSVYVYCGVSYKSDLYHVERVTIDTAKQVLKTVPGAIEDYEPVVRFKEFGDSNINFLVVLRSMDISSHYLLHHEFIKALHKRFNEEGIEISYPVRMIVSGDDASGNDSMIKETSLT